MDKSSPQRAFIDKIRVERFLLDVDIPETMSAGLRSMREDLDRALKLLSEDLYSTKTHFVLELVQNADDNGYGKGVVPSLRFDLTAKTLVVSNNETGFEEPNVDALCRTGKSSKAQKAGYIGEKGIGFKSVFTVSDAPEIHSNGFHFRFDRTAAGTLLGYVVPHWYPPTRKLDPDLTSIVLPAKEDTTFDAALLVDLDAKLLLFLSKLRNLEVAANGRHTQLSRSDQGVLTRLQTVIKQPGRTDAIAAEHFVRVEHDVSMADVIEDKRRDIEQTQVVLALPVSSESKARPDPLSPVYAFLPIRAFGFKFSVQADFLLISSRGDIHTDLEWNRRLRDSIAPTFVKGLPQYKRRQALSLSYLSFLPTEAETVDPFFRPVVTQLLKLLGETECILAEGGQWRKPAEILYGHSEFRELFSSQEVRKLFNLDYAKSDFVANNALLKNLGCEPLSYAHVFSVFSEHQAWFRKRSREWKAKFYVFLSKLGHQNLLDNGILNLPCVPTGRDEFVVPSQKSAFLPLSHDRIYGFEEELSIVDKKLYDKAVALSPSTVVGLFETLNVRQADSYHLITAHIIPKHEGDAWKHSADAALIGHLRYIKENLAGYLEGAAKKGLDEGAALQVLSSKLMIGTKDRRESWFFGSASKLYFSKEYEPTFSIETLLGSSVEPNSFVAPEYLKVQVEDQESKVAVDASGWREFLRMLGVREEPRLKKYTDGDYERGPELQALLESPQSSVRKQTLECIDRHWATYAKALQYNAKSGRSWIPTDTLFIKALRETIAPTRKAAKVPLHESFLDSPELRELFGESAVYIDASLTQPALIQACRITSRADAKACLKRLGQLKSSGTDTTGILRKLYGQLHHLFEKEGNIIRAGIVTGRLVRIRGERSDWVAPEEACWRSNSRLGELVYAPLAGIYGELEVFFTKLGVVKKLPTQRLVAALPRLIEFDTQEVRLREALLVYRECAKELNLRGGQESLLVPRWLELFQKQASFLTVDGRMVLNSTSLFLDDLPEYGHLFYDQPGIDIFAIARAEQQRLSKLLNLLEVQRVSEGLEVDVLDDDLGEVDQLYTRKLQDAFEAIARVVSHYDHDAFERAIEDGAFDELMLAEVHQVERLQLRVLLNGVARTTAGDICVSGGNIVFRKGVKSLPDRISLEVCKLLKFNDLHADAITRFFLLGSAEEIEEFLQVRGIPELSEEDDAALFASRNDVNSNTDADAAPEAAEGADGAGNPTAASNAQAGENGEVGENQSSAPAVAPRPAAAPAAATPPAGHPSNATSETADAPPAPTAPAPRPQPAPAAPTQPPRAGAPAPGAGAMPPKPVGAPRPQWTGGNGQNPAAGNAPTPSTQGGHGAGSGALNGGSTAQGSSSSPPTSATSPASGAGRPSGGPASTPGQAQQTGSRPGANGGVPRPNAYPPQNGRRGRLLSYAEAPATPSEGTDGSDGSDSQNAALREAIANAAVQAFLASKAARWKQLTEMPPNNPGFDVKAVTHDDSEEFVEVKGQSGAWTEEGVALTPTELARAHEARGRYWLCVVEFALDPARRVVHLVNDPFSRVTQFRFDSGWKSQAVIQESAKPLVPEAGLRIEIPNLGSGVIVSALSKGPFFKLQVTLDDGRRWERTFDPATMKLSAAAKPY